ncbi:hypothetical protein PQO03_10130 [Lentisphaera profundi]|uniref:HhH-GPD domain-containing protein n=1 Tax=Lentisphaera profundi TaxID=1658616 RepID=A0ABY7VS80_9BACT|nr:hypothetical protein [Lentisphaera profundi]WDE96070.1 hypothetical protein PQO03_10130 [Lentisphaera profundi]
MQQDFIELIKWSLANYAGLPWRTDERDLYRVLVSEVMLQQTTVGTVLPRYESFFVQFPTLESLAEADEADLALAWKGLGYYRRAQNLYKAVKMIHQSGSDFPEGEEKLQEIPGVGPYTAAALTAIGRNELALAVDGNLQRVLSRYFLIREEQGPKLQKAVQSLMHNKLFAKIIESCGPRKFNEALMDLGRSICKPRNPKCTECSLQSSCKAFHEQCVEEIPHKKEKKKVIISELKLVRVLIRNKSGELLFYKKNKGEWLRDQWELPTIVISSEDKDFKQYPFAKLADYSSEQITTAITRYRIRNHWLEMDELDFRDLGVLTDREFTFLKWPEPQEHISTASEKILRNLNNE